MDKAVPTGFAEFYEGVRNEPIYLILGVQGSGTNLLGRLLTRLYSFSILRDRSIVTRAAARLGASPAQADVEREIRWIEKAIWPSALARKAGRHIIRNSELYAGLGDALRAARPRNGAEFARIIHAYRAYSSGTTRMAVKSDDIWEHLHAIDEVLPNRRVVMLTRDFRDNLMSISGKEFGPREPLCAALYVKHQLGYYAPEFRRSRDFGCHVTFEMLLNDTRRFVDEFSRNFGITPTVDIDTAIPALKFRPNKIGKWRSMSAQQLAWCEGLLQDELKEFGYPLVTTPIMPGSYDLLAASVRDKVRRVPQKFRRLNQRFRS